MARAVNSDAKRRAVLEPLYDFDPRTGTSIEVFYVDHVLAQSFGARGPGWFWWTRHDGFLPDDIPAGPFGTSYLAYRDFTTRCVNLFQHDTLQIFMGTQSRNSCRTNDPDHVPTM